MQDNCKSECHISVFLIFFLSIEPADIVDGNLKLTLGLLQQLANHYPLPQSDRKAFSTDSMITFFQVMSSSISPSLPPSFSIIIIIIINFINRFFFLKLILLISPPAGLMVLPSLSSLTSSGPVSLAMLLNWTQRNLLGTYSQH